MTLKDKINSLTWADLVKKIKVIFLDINSSFDSLIGRISTLESKPEVENIQDASATVSGIVNNTSLQELGGVDKTINGVRVGKGGGNDSNSTAVGQNSLASNTGGYNNTAIGQNTLYSNTNGGGNTAIGQNALNYNIEGGGNTAIGQSALRNSTNGSYNTSIGQYSMTSNTTGGSNTAIGQGSLNSNLTGSNNTAIGFSSLQNSTSGNNTAIGQNALYNNLTGSNNTAIGTDVFHSLTTGDYNIAIGKGAGNIGGAGTITTSNNSIFIGSQTEPAANNQTNQIVIGDFAIGLGTNTTTIGKSATVLTKLFGRVEGDSFKLSTLNTAPASAVAIGETGEVRIDASFIYVCTATNVWKRSALVTW